MLWHAWRTCQAAFMVGYWIANGLVQEVRKSVSTDHRGLESYGRIGRVNSVLTKNQSKEFRVDVPGQVIVSKVCYDDQCGNGHNSFSITAEIYEPYRRAGEPSLIHESGKKMWLCCCGCCHEEVARHFPALAPFIAWHLTSSEGPMHYVANALYWAGHKGYCDGKTDSPPNLKHLKSASIYGALPTDKDFDLESCLYADGKDNEVNAKKLTEWLVGRTEALMLEFKKAVESLGFVY